MAWRVTWRYNARGFETECAQYDAAGRPIVRSGFARRAVVPDARGRWLEAAYFGTDGRPMLYRGGYHVRRIKYDGAGRPVEVSSSVPMAGRWLMTLAVTR